MHTKRVVPGDRVATLRNILVELELEPGGLDGAETLGDSDHVGDSVTNLNPVLQLTMVLVLGVVPVGHEPFVYTEDSTGLQDLEDLGVDTLETGGVDSGFNGVHGVEGVLGEVHLHEITLHERVLVGNAGLLGVVGGTLDLVVVVVEANDVDTGEAGHLAGGTADTAADIKDLHVLLEAHLVGEVVLVAGNCLVEVLALVEAAEMEGLTPAVLVKIGGEVVVVSRQCGIGGSALL